MNNEIATQDDGQINRKQWALTLINAIRHNVYNAIYQMQKLKDEELYKELGYNSLLECLEAELNIKRSTYFNYQKIMGKFLLTDSNLNQSNALDSPSVSMRKLVILSRLPKEQTSRLFTEGKMNIRGREFTIGKIDQTPIEELKNILSHKKKEALKEQKQKNVRKVAAAEYKILEKKLSSVLETVFASKFIIEVSQKEISDHIEECARIIEEHLNFYMK